YLLRSASDPDQRYAGFTTDLRERVKAHNNGRSVHTAKYRPWTLVAYFAFENERRAREFEHYLKSGSGKAFANKRLW
ncbi:MAG: GIY-YIG nuclease family protein, partial [Rhizomicrobium sp.]